MIFVFLSDLNQELNATPIEEYTLNEEMAEMAVFLRRSYLVRVILKCITTDGKITGRVFVGKCYSIYGREVCSP
jgi:hypothetical protein